jgi:hypothetical protein
MPPTVAQVTRKIALPGCTSFWTARRTLRQDVIDALDLVGEAVVPDIDETDAARETGEAVIKAARLNTRRSPVRADSLARGKGIGLEFTQLVKGEDQNSREFLFSIGINLAGKAHFIKKGTHPAFQTLFQNPLADDMLDEMYQDNLRYMPSRDITEALVGFISRNRAVRLKENGGVYFIPECAIDKTVKVFTAMNQCGSRCSLILQDLSDDPIFRQQILDQTTEDLVANLEQMQDEIKDILDNDKKPRINGMKTKMQALSQYHDLLSYYQKTFNDGLVAAQSSLDATCDLMGTLQIRYGGKDQ